MEWEWGIVDKKMAERARKSNMRLLAGEGDSSNAEFLGSDGSIYRTTMKTCDCKDFAMHHGERPCKHIVRLAMESGFLNRYGQTPKQEKEYRIADLRMKLACAYGWYYMFDEPIIQDSEYDSMKKELQSAIVYDRVIALLSDAGEEYIDKSSVGGSIYFFSDNAVELLKQNGFDPKFVKNGAKSTEHRQAWYIACK